MTILNNRLKLCCLVLELLCRCAMLTGPVAANVDPNELLKDLEIREADGSGSDSCPDLLYFAN